jgi:hypothetical protein
MGQKPSYRSFILETVLSFIYPGTILLILFTNICLCSSYPGQCIRKCSSFSIFPDLQTTKYLLNSLGYFNSLGYSYIFDNIVEFKHQYKAKNKRSKFTKSK